MILPDYTSQPEPKISYGALAVIWGPTIALGIGSLVLLALTVADITVFN